MSVYFIHAEVLNGGNVVAKACAIAASASADDAFDLFMGSEEVGET